MKKSIVVVLVVATQMLGGARNTVKMSQPSYNITGPEQRTLVAQHALETREQKILEAGVGKLNAEVEKSTAKVGDLQPIEKRYVNQLVNHHMSSSEPKPAAPAGSNILKNRVKQLEQHALTVADHKKATFLLNTQNNTVKSLDEKIKKQEDFRANELANYGNALKARGVVPTSQELTAARNARVAAATQ